MTTSTLQQVSGVVLDQGNIGSCAENAFVSAIDLQMRLSGDEISLRSRLQLYADVRTAQNTFNVDTGTSSEVMLEVAKLKGVASESSWAYNPSALYTVPPASVYSEASNYKVMSYSIVNLETQYDIIANRCKALIDQGKPVLLGFMAGNAFFAEDGPLASQVNHWDWNESGEGHMVVVEGYDDNLNGGSYIVKNSWGTGWGDNGYGTIRYDQFHVLSDDLNGMYTIDGFAGHDWTYTESRHTAAELYAFTLNRCGEHTGLFNLANALSNGMSQAQAADIMMNSEEGKLIFTPGMTSLEIADTIYLQVLGRHADAEGGHNLALRIDNGWTKGQAMSLMMDSLDNYIGSDLATQREALRYDNRTLLSEFYGITMEREGEYSHEAISQITWTHDSVEYAKYMIEQHFNII